MRGKFTGGKQPRPIEDRFWEKVDKNGLDGCWLWMAQLDRAGYGRFFLSKAKQSALAHRVAYELLVGPISEGLELDHLCRVPACVNPGHLEPVTHRENCRRGLRGDLTTCCPNGHPYEGDNVILTSSGHRRCRTCLAQQYERQREERQKRRKGPRTHCRKGHPYEGDNVYYKPNGTRECRVCSRAAEKARKQR